MLKFEVGKYYKLRDGTKAKLIYVLENKRLVIIHMYKDKEISTELHINGFMSSNNITCNIDIITEWKEPIIQTFQINEQGYLYRYSSHINNNSVDIVRLIYDSSKPKGQRITEV